MTSHYDVTERIFFCFFWEVQLSLFPNIYTCPTLFSLFNANLNSQSKDAHMKIRTIRCKTYVTTFKNNWYVTMPPSPPPKQCWTWRERSAKVSPLRLLYVKLNIVMGGRGVIVIFLYTVRKEYDFPFVLLCNISFCTGLSAFSGDMFACYTS